MSRLCYRWIAAFVVTASYVSLSHAAEPQWIRVSSSHFSVLTDGGEKKGREVALRLEQMRSVFSQLLMRTRVNMPEPLDIIALRSDEEFVKIAPIRQGQPVSGTGFFLPGEDRNYIVLDLLAEEPWRAISHEFAHLLLNYNYPPTQPWFDEGFAEYFSSIRLDNKQVQMGSDPDSLSELLNGPAWVSITDLFATKHDGPGYQEATHHTAFHAESWIVMHYLLNKNKLPETGNYFELVQNQKVLVGPAIQQAYGISAAQFEQAVKDYFRSLDPLLHGKQPSPTNAAAQAYQFPTPVGDGDVGMSAQQVSDADAQALLAEMKVRLSEHREQGVKELEAIVNDPKTENSIAHRALAWVYMDKKATDDAIEQLSKAMELDSGDPWVRYYLALVKYRAAQASGQPFHGLSNMMQDLRAVLDWNPDFAEAYSMLAMARVEGGGINSAMESMRAAIQLSPRNENYLLNMGQIYMAGKKWDAATALLDRLKSSQNPQIAKAAQKSLEDLPTLKQYGIWPQQTVANQPTVTTPAPRRELQQKQPKPSTPEKEDEASADREEQLPAEPQPDKRKVQFLKGKLVSVDCGQAPVAVLTIAAGTRTMKLRTENYKSLLLIGADEFSCDWENRPVAVNYKAGGKANGDLVSLEVQ
jgi:tetratricopeptide (TPR) repeat protein